MQAFSALQERISNGRKENITVVQDHQGTGMVLLSETGGGWSRKPSGRALHYRR
jgi:hypothetical protein